jgi:DNA invertase Pin-like site-specific DNA recombinase
MNDKSNDVPQVRAVLYARVSTTDQNCEMQVRELREYCSRRGWMVSDEYIDTGFSGAKSSRPALDRMMADASQHRFDCIVVYKIDRFGRSVLHLNQQLATLTSYGVTVHRHESIVGYRREQPHQPFAVTDSSQRSGVRAGDDPGAGVCWGT